MKLLKYVIIIAIVSSLFSCQESSPWEADTPPQKLELRFVNQDPEINLDHLTLQNLEMDVILNNAHVKGANVNHKKTQYWERYEVYADLTDEFAFSFRKLTKDNIGRYMAFTLNDKIVSSPRIIDEYKQKKVLVADFKTEAEALEVAAGILKEKALNP